MQNVKQKIAWLWQNAERILILIFFLTFSFNIRKVFLTPFSFLNGGFNEYTTMSFSWADLLMIATIVIYTTKSILRQVINPYYAPFGHRNEFEKLLKYVSRETLYLLLFLGWVGLSILWSQYRPIAAYRFLTLIEIVLFSAIVIKSLKNSQWLDIALFALVFNGLFQSLLGIAQFVHNSSQGLHFLGEVILGSNIYGVAKILINGEKHIRAYGTFPHPNIMASFLLIPLFIIIAELVGRMFSSLIRGKAPDDEMENNKQTAKVSHETILGFIPTSFFQISFFLTILGFALTFSRSAFLGLFFGLLVYFILIVHPQVLIKKIKNSPKILTFGLIALVFVIVALFYSTSIFSDQSLRERRLYQYVSYETILSHPVQGIGIGQFVLNEYQLHPNLESWRYQPVHNLYLLVFSELGAIGFILLLLFLISLTVRVYTNKKRRGDLILTSCLFCCIILSFLIVSFFDHYFWDIKAGMTIFVLPLIFLCTTRKN